MTSAERWSRRVRRSGSIERVDGRVGAPKVRKVLGLTEETPFERFHLAPLNYQHDISMLELLYKTMLVIAPLPLRLHVTLDTAPHRAGPRSASRLHDKQLVVDQSPRDLDIYTRSIWVCAAKMYNCSPQSCVVGVEEVFCLVALHFSGCPCCPSLAVS